MQFKRQKHKIQVLAYRGYDKEKRRAIVKMMGSLDAYSLEPSGDLLDNLTDEEKDELKAYIEKKEQSERIKQLEKKMECMPMAAADIADAITSGDLEPDSQWARSLWTGVDELSKAMRKVGFPKSQYNTAKPPQGSKDELKPHQQGLPMGDTSKGPKKAPKKRAKKQPKQV